MKKFLLTLSLTVFLAITYAVAQKTCAGVNFTPIKQYPIWLGTNYSFGSFLISGGDFDGDGKEDLVFVGNSKSGYKPTLILQRNIRTGILPSQVGFDTSVPIFQASGQIDFVVNDLNNDGKPDLALVYGDSVQVFINHSTTGVFAFYKMTLYGLPSAEAYTTLKSEDYDGDGKQDLMIEGSDKQLYVLLNTGYTSTTASFGAAKTVGVSFSPGIGGFYSWHSYDAVDMNNDNLPDVAYASPNSDTVFIYQNESTAGTVKFKLAQAFKAPEKMATSQFWDGRHVQIRDLNGDGKNDIAVLYGPNGSYYSGHQKLLFLINKTVGLPINFAFSDTLEINHFTKSPYKYKLDDTGLALTGAYPTFSDFSLVNNDPCKIKPDILLSVEGAGQTFSMITYLANTSTLTKISYSAPCWFKHFTSDRASVGQFSGTGKDDLLSMCDVCIPGTPNYGLSMLENMSTIPNGSNKITIDTIKIPCHNVTTNGNILAKIHLPCRIYKHFGTDTVTMNWAPKISTSDTATLVYNKYYTLHVYNQSHNYDTTVHIIFNDPDGNAISVSFSDTTICKGRGIKLNVSNYNKAYKYHWWPDSSIVNDSTPNPIVNPTVTTTYNVTATGGKCVINNSVVVHVHNPATVVLSPSDTIVCAGRPVQLSAFGARSYVWTPGKYLDKDSIQSPTACVDSTTTFKAEGFDGYCFIDMLATVAVLPTPKVHAGNRWIIHTNESHYIGDSYVSGDYFNYWWKPAIYMNDTTLIHPTVAPPVSMWYYLYAVNAYGCMAKDSIFIKFDPLGHITVPNSFTPNSDGLNDFLVINKENIRTFHIEIYNRWGQLVFTADNLYRNWDGRFNGEPEPMGSYVYFIQATDIGGHPVNLQGNITLLR